MNLFLSDVPTGLRDLPASFWCGLFALCIACMEMVQIFQYMLEKAMDFIVKLFGRN